MICDFWLFDIDKLAKRKDFTLTLRIFLSAVQRRYKASILILA